MTINVILSLLIIFAFVFYDFKKYKFITIFGLLISFLGYMFFKLKLGFIPNMIVSSFSLMAFTLIALLSRKMLLIISVVFACGAFGLVLLNKAPLADLFASGLYIALIAFLMNDFVYEKIFNK